MLLRNTGHPRGAARPSPTVRQNREAGGSRPFQLGAGADSPEDAEVTAHAPERTAEAALPERVQISESTPTRFRRRNASREAILSQPAACTGFHAALEVLDVRVEPGDVVLLGTDGLFDNLTDAEILSSLRDAASRPRLVPVPAQGGARGPLEP